LYRFESREDFNVFCSILLAHLPHSGCQKITPAVIIAAALPARLNSVTKYL
jgi:hypothetical protein